MDLANCANELEEEEYNMSMDGSHSGGSSQDDDSAESAGTTLCESGSSGQASSDQTSSDLTNTSVARHNASNRDNDRSDSCGSGSSADSHSRSDKHGSLEDHNYGFSNYGPSKKSSMKTKDFMFNKVCADESYSTNSYANDVLSRMYGPSKQAHDAKSIKSKSKKTIHEYDGMLDGLRPI